MTELIASSKLTVVVGLGATGLSVARYLAKRGERFVVVDNRVEPPGLSELARVVPQALVELGEFNDHTLRGADRLVVSPGLALAQPALRGAVEAGVAVTGDIQLFADSLREKGTAAPIVAITGSNGKSTVTTLVGEMARAAGLNVGVGGNLGVPALDLLAPDRDLYVVELSSFQLELVEHLGATVATVLNVSSDHMDRYPDLKSYHAAKHRIFRGTRQVVVNRDDALSRPLVANSVDQWSFGLDKPDFKGFGVMITQDEPWLAFEYSPLMPVAELAMRGRHNLANALAALALGHAAGLSMAPMLAALRAFRGLPHRCEWVAEKGGVTWIDDSKATNVGAAMAAIEGLSEKGLSEKGLSEKGSSEGYLDDEAGNDLILIAGGQGKGQDFAPLGRAARQRVRLAVLIGEDAGAVAEALRGVCDVVYATSLSAAVSAAAESARPGDKVLLSPACASFDMFKGFADRGEQFVRAVEALAVDAEVAP
ncbi:MAG: UDP-N-acetylmuramoyl-L-alanine--D-glutamate ligase [Bacteroidales bacterium]|nr:UDP-N-acetylmuramoyl-L-alanine--D-glutamate ligase [Bacteroidales bacterium]